MAQGKFVTVINCMDGRVQEPVIHWLKAQSGADYVDSITEAGPDKLLSEHDAAVLARVHEKALISRDVHGSRILAMVSHEDCAGNPVPKDAHLVQLNECMEVLSSWNLRMRLLGLWVDINWQVEVIHDRPAS